MLPRWAWKKCGIRDRHCQKKVIGRSNICKIFAKLGQNIFTLICKIFAHYNAEYLHKTSCTHCISVVKMDVFKTQFRWQVCTRAGDASLPAAPLRFGLFVLSKLTLLLRLVFIMVKSIKNMGSLCKTIQLWSSLQQWNEADHDNYDDAW